LLPVVLFCLIFLAAGCSGTKESPEAASDSPGACSACHAGAAAVFSASAHGQNGLSCADCHTGADEHLRDRQSRPATDWRGETCASCHEKEYREWQASPHNQIPLEQLPRDPRIGECMKCHQASGFAAVIASGRNFKETWGPPPQSEPEPVTCAACHSPHNGTHSYLLRLLRAELCATCHGGKWQNQVLSGSGGHHYAGIDWPVFGGHPHNSGNRCVACHMARTPGAISSGGHTFRMRAGSGESPNTAPCLSCHGETADYNISGRQQEVETLLGELRLLLEQHNNGRLPGFQPGACNQCHRGGMQPFDHDPDLILGKAYENYLLVERDKSLGVHNPPYVLQLLRSTITSVREEYRR
jgi:predicted CXXCH cytochrome family protein